MGGKVVAALSPSEGLFLSLAFTASSSSLPGNISCQAFPLRPCWDGTVGGDAEAGCISEWYPGWGYSHHPQHRVVFPSQGMHRVGLKASLTPQIWGFFIPLCPASSQPPQRWGGVHLGALIQQCLGMSSISGAMAPSRGPPPAPGAHPWALRSHAQGAAGLAQGGPEGLGRARASPEKAVGAVERKRWREQQAAAPPGERAALMLGLGAGCSPWRLGWAEGCLASRAGGGPGLPPQQAPALIRGGGVEPPSPPSASYWGAVMSPHPGKQWLRAGEQPGGVLQCLGRSWGLIPAPPNCSGSSCPPPRPRQGTGSPSPCLAQLSCA